MDSRTRKDLKTDKFAEEVEHTWSFLTHHTSEVKRYGAIAAAVLVIVGGIYAYTHHQATMRAEALASAIRISDAVVSPTPHPPDLNFPTADAKETAVTQAYSDLAAQYHGSQEGAIAQLYLGGVQLNKGKLPEAAKIYLDMVDSAPGPYKSIAKLTLAKVYSAQEKDADSEKLLKELIASPSVFVSKEEATLVLAEVLAKTNPAEARKVLEPLRTTTRSTVSQAVVNALGNLPPSSASN